MKNWWNEGIQSGWIGTYEVEMIRFMEQEFGELTDEEKLCFVFTSLFLKAGHTCLPVHLSPILWGDILDLDLDAETKTFLSNQPVPASNLANSRLVGTQANRKPFVLENGMLMFRRFWVYEKQVAEWITMKGQSGQISESYRNVSDPLDDLFNQTPEDDNWQKVAAAMSAIKPFVIISGGPGTGKTTTVARILALHQKLAGRPLSIALAAPTGKAAGRMGEALNRELKNLGLSGEELARIPREAKTVHRLLSGTERRGLLPPVEKKMLRYDLVIVDEASMIDLTLMHRLLTHLSDHTRLILLGDKDQLASVEAGSVFADLCQKSGNQFSKSAARRLEQAGIAQPLPVAEGRAADTPIVYLTKSYRFGSGSGIGQLAEFVKQGSGTKEDLQELFVTYADVNHLEFEYQKNDVDNLLTDLVQKLAKTGVMEQAADVLEHWKQSIWLTVLRRGLTGTDRLNRLVEEQIVARRLVAAEQGWYHGRPVIITRNDYNLSVFNGDLGVCIQDADGLWVHVESGSETKRLKPGRLQHFEPAYFLTVHKSQGSEFNRVNFLLPKADTPILTKELIYTAITRARNNFSLYGDLGLFLQGIHRETRRFTGLKGRLQVPTPPAKDIIG